jgi:OmpA-OmpF porin, OOP family
MKPNTLLTVFAVTTISFANAQQTINSKKPRLLSYNISFQDYYTPKLINDSSAGKAIDSGDWYKPAKKSFGIGVSYWKGLTQTIDFSASLTGTFSNFPALFVKGDSVGQASFTPQIDALLHFKLFKEKAKVNPFLTAGLGAGYFKNQFAAYAPVGTGLQFRFNQGAYLILQMQWRKAFTGINQDYLHYSIGFAQSASITKKKTETVKEIKPIVPADKDGDGVEDRFDQCPDAKGTANGCPDADSDGIADKDDLCPNDKGSMNGCPDTDNDGVADKDDLCPNDKGTMNGCPDTDNDGVADNEDKCKDAAGVPRYNGCPVPDTDKDGVNDEEDKCPTDAGITDNNGCPEIKQEVKQTIEFAARNILFMFASDSILSKSYKPLNEVVKVLQENPALKLTIEAHADNRGTPQGNMLWSEKRAKAVANYFISKGIAADRIISQGFGDTVPVADNTTAKGRTKNRRVEMKVFY